ncbi:hypothetical protein BSK33_17240, partial [Geobacillus sp. 44B]
KKLNNLTPIEFRGKATTLPRSNLGVRLLSESFFFYYCLLDRGKTKHHEQASFKKKTYITRLCIKN